MMNLKKAALKGPISLATSRPAIKVPPQNTAVRNNFSRTRNMGVSRKLDQKKKNVGNKSESGNKGILIFIYSSDIVLQPGLLR